MLYNIDTLSQTLVDFMKIPQKFGAVGEGVEREDLVASHLKQLIPELEEDEVGNLYWINENTPLLNAHMDTVGSATAQQFVDNISYCNINLASVLDTTTGVERCESYELENPKPTDTLDKKAWEARKFLTAYESTIKGIIGTHNIGADDKCGIVLAYALYKEFGNKISLLFTRGEETGMHGVRHFCKEHNDLLDKCTYCILGDRRNGKDLICNVHTSKYGSLQFEQKVLEHIGKYGYVSVQGGSSDMNYIKEYLNGFNISVGYYGPHTDNEYVIAEEFFNTYEAMHTLISNFNEKLPVVKFTYPASTTTTTYYGGTFSPYGKQNRRLFDDDNEFKSLKSSYGFFAFNQFKFSNKQYVSISKPISFTNVEDADDTYYIPSGVMTLVMMKRKNARKGAIAANAYNLPSAVCSFVTCNPNRPPVQDSTTISHYDNTIITLSRDLSITIESESYYKKNVMNGASAMTQFRNSGHPIKFFIPKGTYELSSSYVIEDFDLMKAYIEKQFNSLSGDGAYEYDENTGLMLPSDISALDSSFGIEEEYDDDDDLIIAG